jgi:hypothetical protein
MSEAVLTGSLLDFGAPFWGTTRMVEEFPGLAAKGMASLGQFGIGFFSVFILGDHVRVITRRPDHAESDALLLEFRDGIAVAMRSSGWRSIGAGFCRCAC